MDFKKTVMSDVHDKYKNMANDQTVCPFHSSLTVTDPTAYSKKRDKYYKRLEKEMETFNDAIDQVCQTRDIRINQENDHKTLIKKDRRRYIPCRIISIIAIILMCVLCFFGLQNGVQEWADNTLIPAMGFGNFFNPDTVPFIISILIGIIVAITVFFATIKKGDSECCEEFGFLGVVIATIVSGAASFFLIRLLIVGIGYLISLCLNQYTIIGLGVISIIIQIILSRKFELKRNKVKISFDILIIVLITIVCFYIGNGYVNSFTNEEIQSIVSFVGWSSVIN